MVKTPRVAPNVSRIAAVVGLTLAAGNSHALRFEFGDISASLNTSMETGLQWRMQDRDSRLIGKANLDPELCRISSCQGQTHFANDVPPDIIGEGPARNQRAADAPGIFSGNFDDGDLNFDKYDLTQGLFKAKQDLTLDVPLFGLDFRFFTRYYGHYDFVNYDEPVFHPNIITPNVIVENPDAAPPFNDDDPPNRRTSVGEAALVPRNSRQNEKLGLGFTLLDFNLNTRLPFIGDRELDLTVGRQLINWGESTYLAIGSLNTFSAPSAIALFRPAFLNIDEVFQPLGAVSFKTDLFYDIGISGFYGYEWQPADVSPPGSFLSFVDLDTNNSADSVAINFGKTAEDPNSLALGNQSLLVALAETGATAELLPQKEARGGGQYGLGLSFYFENIFTGTEFNLYYANYHSRLPFLSAFAGNVGCLENVVPTGLALNDTNNVTQACPTADLNTAIWASVFNGDPGNDPNGGAPEQNTGRQDNPDTYSLPGQGGTAYPLDTVKFQLEYPEDIKMMGFSFNTAIGDIAFQGEFAYRPDDPLQVATVDLGFSALQTVFPSGCAANPEQCVANFEAIGVDCTANPGACAPGGALDFLDVTLGAGATVDSQLGAVLGGIPGVDLGDLGLPTGGSTLATITGQEFVGPSFLLDYRGINSHSTNPDGTPRANGLQPFDYIRGYEPFQTINWILGATYVIGPDNPLFADQIILLFEGGGTHVLDLPDLSELQIEGPGQVTHASAGADGTGTDNLDPTGQTMVELSRPVDGIGRSGLNTASGARFNPSQADPGKFVTPNSLGYDIIALIRYESVFPGISFEPRVLIKHDVYGISPGPGERFVENRQLYQFDVEMRVRNAISFTAGYTWFTGATGNNVLRDRDYAQFGARYRF